MIFQVVPQKRSASTSASGPGRDQGLVGTQHSADQTPRHLEPTGIGTCSVHTSSSTTTLLHLMACAPSLPASVAHGYLTDTGLFEFLDKAAPLADAALAQQVVRDLQHVLAEWARCAPTSAAQLSAAVGSIAMSGSYVLGVRTTACDIDVVYLSTHHQRATFFALLPAVLRASPYIASVVVVPTARIPLITMQIRGLCIDLLFASLPDVPVFADRDMIPSMERLDDSVVSTMDGPSALSISGPRTATFLLRCAPDVTTFRVVLRALRHWAQARGIYSSTMGFLNGASIAIMVACVCRSYPSPSAVAIIRQFFAVFARWWWPIPVTIDALRVEHVEPLLADAGMRILTPQHPVQNCAHSVTMTNLLVVQGELKRAWCITDEARWGDQQSLGHLFAPSDFFLQFDLYVTVQVTTIAAAYDSTSSWQRYVASHMRLLAESIRGSEPLLFSGKDSVSAVRLWPIAAISQLAAHASHTTPLPARVESSFYIGMLRSDTSRRLDLRPLLEDFDAKLHRWCGWRSGMDVRAYVLPWKKLPAAVFAGRGGREQAIRERAALRGAAEQNIYR